MDKTPRKLAYRCILPIAMLFLTAYLAASAVAYKIVSLGPGIASGAVLIFPITYAIGDIVAEVYGYAMARNLIWFSLSSQFLFACFIVVVIELPSPIFWHYQTAYYHVFGSLLRFILAGTIANIASNFINIYTISKWKIPCEGKYFWIRSVCATLLGSMVMVLITIGISYSGKMGNPSFLIKMMFTCYIVEILYALILATPALLISNFLKRIENIDVYDHDTNFNPFRLR